MKPVLQKLICLALFCFLQGALAENRFLFIVDTSSPMKRRIPEVEKTLRELILSGINNELRHGDTFTIWTFNDKLSPGKFPMQIWRPENKLRIADTAAQFIAEQRCEKTARFDRVRTEMLRVVADSGKVVVIIVTDGTTALRGTPFDGKINTVFEKHRAELREGKTAFVVALLAENGEFVSHTMNSTAGPIWIPLLPGAAVPATNPEPKRKTAADSLVAATPPPASNTPPAVEAQVSASPPKSDKKQPDAALVSPSPGLKPIPLEKTPGTVVLKTNAATASASLTATNAPRNISTPKTNQEAAAAKNQSPNPVVKPATDSPAIAARPPAVTDPAAVAKIVPAITNQPIVQPVVQKVAADQPKPPATPQTNSRPPPPTTVAVSTPPTDSKTGTRLVMAAALLMVILIVLMALRKPRASPQGSLITRSLENPGPPKKD